MQLFKKCILSLGNYSLTLEMLTIYIYIYVHIYIYINIMDYYSDIKRSEIRSFVMMWLDLVCHTQ